MEFSLFLTFEKFKKGFFEVFKMARSKFQYKKYIGNYDLNSKHHKKGLDPTSNPNEHIVYLNFVAHSKPRDKAENSIIRTCVMFSFESSDFRRLCDFGLFRTNIAIS